LSSPIYKVISIFRYFLIISIFWTTIYQKRLLLY
jgi:hypothetical protein